MCGYVCLCLIALCVLLYKQGGSIDDISVILIHQLLATLKYRGSLQGTIDFSTVNFDRYLGWHFDLKVSVLFLILICFLFLII